MGLASPDTSKPVLRLFAGKHVDIVVLVLYQSYTAIPGRIAAVYAHLRRSLERDLRLSLLRLLLRERSLLRERDRPMMIRRGLNGCEFVWQIVVFIVCFWACFAKPLQAHTLANIPISKFSGILFTSGVDSLFHFHHHHQNL